MKKFEEADYKYCSKCECIYPTICFNKNKGEKDGLYYYCIFCRRKYYLEHIDKKMEYNRKYRLEHIDEMREYNRKYYLEHIDKKMECNRKYRLEHIDERKEYGKFWRECHPFYNRIWRESNGNK